MRSFREIGKRLFVSLWGHRGPLIATGCCAGMERAGGESCVLCGFGLLLWFAVVISVIM